MAPGYSNISLINIVGEILIKKYVGSDRAKKIPAKKIQTFIRVNVFCLYSKQKAF